MTTSELPLPPGRFGAPLVGETLEFLADWERFAATHAHHGPVFKTHIFGRPMVVVSGAEAIRYLFAQNKDNFVVAWPKSAVSLLGERSIAVQDGSGHQRMRRILQQAFGHEQLAAHAPRMDRIAQEHVEAWVRAGAVALCPRLNTFTFQIACALILGAEDQTAELLELFETLLAGLFSIAVPLPLSRYRAALAARDELIARIKALANPRVSRGERGVTALSVLLAATDEQGAKLTMDDIADTIITLLFAGYETSSSGLASLCLLLARNPHVFERLRDELLATELSGPMTLERARGLRYLDQVVKEVLRVIPPVSGSFRRVVNDCVINGYRIPKGWTVLYSISATHKEVLSFTAPEAFDPDRFDPDRAEDRRTRFSWIPFGAGPHMCVGVEYARLEMAILGARLVRDYRWELLPDQDLSMVTVAAPRPRSGLMVRIRRQ